VQERSAPPSITSSELSPDAEWLEADGLGGFASGMVRGPRRRRYHGLLLVARQPPVDRVLLVHGFDAWFERGGVRTLLTTQRYHHGVESDGDRHLAGFDREPWPTWTFQLPDGTIIEQELAVLHRTPAVCLRWRVRGAPGRLVLRPFLSGRDIHALHHENSVLAFDAAVDGEIVHWQPYLSLPRVRSWANAGYRHAPQWYRHFDLLEEAARGFDGLEDLASPGELEWNLSAEQPAVWMLSAEGQADPAPPIVGAASDRIPSLLRAEQHRREQLGDRLARAADAYIVRRGGGQSVIAGYPWFTDWGRDTFIALRGICLATGRLHDAREILLAWAGTVSDGMLPNRFVDQGGKPEFNAVDASLWFVVAAYEWQAAMRRAHLEVPPADRHAIDGAVQAILSGYAAGTRFGIVADRDGLLRAGVPGVQLTWMDARIGDWVVTPRVGKPVEVQALWINALRIGGRRWTGLRLQAEASFADRFWNPASGGLHDVVDADHVAGAVDASIRPNQLFAVGGLPWPLLSGERARSMVDLVERELWTPLGPRSLAPASAGYVLRYRGTPEERDGAYHQGTVWPWLAGAFIEAWLRTRPRGPRARAEARQRFLQPFLDHLDTAGLGHVSEVADAEAPHHPGGCPFQAWSVGELLRLDRRVLAPPARVNR
jgi:predicted glycogen debranching enzyme